MNTNINDDTQKTHLKEIDEKIAKFKKESKNTDVTDDLFLQGFFENDKRMAKLKENLKKR